MLVITPMIATSLPAGHDAGCNPRPTSITPKAGVISNGKVKLISTPLTPPIFRPKLGKRSIRRIAHDHHL